MVVANCARFTSLTVSETAVNVVKLLKDMLNLVPFGTDHVYFSRALAVRLNLYNINFIK